MSRPEIEAFLVDDVNEEKAARHGVSIHRVTEVLENVHVVVPNRKVRRGLYLIIGRDRGGSAITVPVEPTHEPGVWRPVTAWPSKPHELTLLQKGERR